MKLTNESTDKLTDVPQSVVGQPPVRCRVWRGVTEAGVEVVCFVHLIAVHKDKDQSIFERELEEQLQPGSVVDLRMVL